MFEQMNCLLFFYALDVSCVKRILVKIMPCANENKIHICQRIRWELVCHTHIVLWTCIFYMEVSVRKKNKYGTQLFPYLLLSCHVYIVKITLHEAPPPGATNPFGTLAYLGTWT